MLPFHPSNPGADSPHVQQIPHHICDLGTLALSASGEVRSGFTVGEFCSLGHGPYPERHILCPTSTHLTPENLEQPPHSPHMLPSLTSHVTTGAMAQIVPGEMSI